MKPETKNKQMDRLDNILVLITKWGVISALLILGLYFLVRQPKLFGVFVIFISIAISSQNILMIRVSIHDIKYVRRKKTILALFNFYFYCPFLLDIFCDAC